MTLMDHDVNGSVDHDHKWVFEHDMDGSLNMTSMDHDANGPVTHFNSWPGTLIRTI